jgi:3'-phosphoadenosine 5'-phosphosulfate sulfotransferase (PAPS reductase)/FAD synthetase
MNEKKLVEETRGIIIEALSKSKNPVIAFSGGKDSTVVLNLVRSINPDVTAVFCNTGVEARETVEYCKTIDNLIELKPDGITFWDCVKKYGYPDFKGKKGHHDGNKCCVYLKEKPAKKYYKENHIDLIFTGLTMRESRNRMLLLKHRGFLYYAKSWGLWKCHPIGNWTEKQVWEYIKDNNISYNSGYDLGWRRCGCQPCTAHKNWGKRLAIENPKLLRFILKQRYGQRQCGDYYNFGENL